MIKENMENSTMNVFKGSNSIIQYFDPDLQPPVPLVEIPDKLNPFRGDNVRIYAKMLTALPAQNVKALPGSNDTLSERGSYLHYSLALNMLLNEPAAGSKSIVEASSGSTAVSLAMLSRVLYDNEDVCAYITNKQHPEQLKVLRFFGLKM
jgi:cysteine synthase